MFFPSFLADPRAIWLGISLLAVLGTASRLYVYSYVNRVVRELHELVSYFTAQMPDLLSRALKADNAEEAVATFDVALRQLSKVMDERLSELERRASRHLRSVPDVV